MATSYLAGVLGLLGSKPVVPPAPNVDPQQAQSTAVKGNIASLPDLEKLAPQADRFSSAELMKQLEAVSPGIGKALGKIPGILEAQLEGKVADDVTTLA